jgi:hypothetical protein
VSYVVNEQQWLANTDPEWMLDFLSSNGRLTERQARLFAVAVCRRIWPLLAGEPSRRAVEVAEGYAEGRVRQGDLEAAQEAAHEYAIRSPPPWSQASYAAEAASWAAWEAAAAVAETLAQAAAHAKAYPPLPGEGEEGPWEAAEYIAERAAQCVLLRDIFANPFRPLPPLPASLLRWQDGIIPKMANAIYDERDLPSGHLRPDRLAVLADGLQDAGCSDALLPGHLRGGGVHVRGCWAVDAVMGRQ